MKPAEILYEMQAIRKVWHNNNFAISPELNRRYCELLQLRRDRVSQFYQEGRVATGSQTPDLKAREAARQAEVG